MALREHYFRSRARLDEANGTGEYGFLPGTPYGGGALFAGDAVFGRPGEDVDGHGAGGAARVWKHGHGDRRHGQPLNIAPPWIVRILQTDIAPKRIKTYLGEEEGREWGQAYRDNTTAVGYPIRFRLDCLCGE
ncbi:hypothetical protein OG21DRAFT_1137936 [Imleria badia]|nr:hypothetical protein OG21DRAFT_1137936 [Imleria badia]